YDENPARRVMLAEAEGAAAGILMVSLETEGKGVGSVGCTAVRPACRGRHIAVNLVKLATGQLKAAGMTDAFLGYTYSGLDYMYGLAGYKICVYYMMARKDLSYGAAAQISSSII
ncbi:MAG: GNAT family N-acetyltransferase, partial [Clostridia bacterium]|nr:GNAT family N-acetyltransferase [Clostridia bacterium]